MRSALLIPVATLALIQVAGCPTMLTEITEPGARLTTTEGDIVIRLDEERAPITTSNFKRYARDDFYDDTVFHRVISGFVVQGGGYDADLVERETRDPIANEAGNGLTNTRGAVAMARLEDADSATAQFFVNLVNNPDLDASTDSAGYAVFAHVIEGMDVIDRIAAIPTEQRDGHTDVPVTDVLITDVELIDLSTGGFELTPEGAVYLEDTEYRLLSRLRETAVDVLTLWIASR